MKIILNVTTDQLLFRFIEFGNVVIGALIKSNDEMI